MEGIKLCKAEVVWDIADHTPHLLEILEKNNPWAHRNYLGMRGEVPVASTCEPFEHNRYFRPIRHVRTFYMNVPGGSVLGIKGSEVLADDLADLLAGLNNYRVSSQRRGSSLWSAIEHFPLVEQKVPAALLRTEAEGEARARK